MKRMEETITEYVVCYYNSEHLCIDVKRYDFKDLIPAINYCVEYNKGHQKDIDYVKLYAYIKNIGFILMLGEPEELNTNNLHSRNVFSDELGGILTVKNNDDNVNLTIQEYTDEFCYDTNEFTINREAGLKLINILTQNFK